MLNVMHILVTKREDLVYLVEINETCDDHDKCEDALVVKAFSHYCTINTYTKIVLTSCVKTFLKASCNKGINGTCGYLKTDKCQLLYKYSDEVSMITLPAQQVVVLLVMELLSSQRKCNNQKTEISCNNTIGCDKLKECSNFFETTFESCKSQTITSGTGITD
ncbi:unnamed protein product [Paramecium primaurelia]|uniref:Uncharacterized protein n=1 Tax=Paramecium primaurelia TaxID=5886 RepID=A0A8S1MUF8_PARPR|nr:unnamed protein product [Paramecium primaurelia]